MLPIPHRAVWSLIVATLILSSIVVAPSTSVAGVSVGIPQNVRLTGTIEGIDVRWAPPSVGKPTNYRIAYKAVERPNVSRNWSFSYSEGNTIHLIRHLAGGYEFNVFVQACEANCDGKWANGGTVFTKSPSARIPTVTSTPIPTATAVPTATPTPSTPTPMPVPVATWIPKTPVIHEYSTGGGMSGIPWVRIKWGTQHQGAYSQIAYRRASDEEWTFIDTTWTWEYTIRNLGPSTVYLVKLRGWDTEKHGPWSNTIKTRTEPLITPTPFPACVLYEGETGYGDGEHDYIGHGNNRSRGAGLNNLPTVRFTNPHVYGSWEYGVRIRWNNAIEKARLTVGSDGTWRIRFGEYYASDVVASGNLNLILQDGETNAIRFSLYSETSAGFTVNGVFTHTGIPDEIAEFLVEYPGGHRTVDYWIDAISTVSGTEFAHLGIGRQCHDS